MEARQRDRLANPHVTGFAAVDDVGLRHIDLQIFGVQASVLSSIRPSALE